MRKKMNTSRVQRTYNLRKYTVEPIIGNYKQNLRFREFITRGLDSVKTGFNLVFSAINLKKIWLKSKQIID